MSCGRTHLWILWASPLILLALAVSPARAAKPSKRIETSSPGPAVMTPAEREKLARWQAGEYPAVDPGTLLTPLPPLRWDAVRTTPAEGAALCIYGLINNHQGVTIPVDSYFHLNQQVIFWSAFAVRPLGSADWDVRMYDTTAPDPQCVSSLLTVSEFPTGVDFVVGDYNHSPLGSDYIFVNRFAGTEDAIVQWDTGADFIGLTGAIHRSYTPNDIIEIWDVNFAAKHNYTFYLDGGVIGNTGLTLQIFQNPASAPYYAPRDVNIHQQGAGYGNVTPIADDWYGLTVVNENGGTGQYDVAIRECTNPLQLPYEDSRALTAPGEIFFVQPGTGAWAGMGVRGDNGSGWIAQLREFGNTGPWPACNGPLVASDEGLQTRLVLGDFHVNPPGEYYPVGLKMIGTGAGGGRLEWDDGRKFIVVNGGAVSKTPPASDVFELWNVSLARNFPYTIEFASAGANYKLFLFGNPTGSVYWPIRSQRILETTANRTVFTPTFTGAYALVVVNDNGAVGDYSVAILSGAVGVADAGAPAPVTRLTGAAPNPTRGDVRIDFELGRADKVDLAVVDVAGRTVARVAGRNFSPGSWSEHWTGKDSNGRPVPAGTYWIRLAAGGREIGRQKVLVVR